MFGLLLGLNFDYQHLAESPALFDCYTRSWREPRTSAHLKTVPKSIPPTLLRFKHTQRRRPTQQQQQVCRAAGVLCACGRYGQVDFACSPALSRRPRQLRHTLRRACIWARAPAACWCCLFFARAAILAHRQPRNCSGDWGVDLSRAPPCAPRTHFALLLAQALVGAAALKEKVRRDAGRDAPGAQAASAGEAARAASQPAPGQLDS